MRRTRAIPALAFAFLAALAPAPAAQTLYGVETNFAAPRWRSSAANGTGVSALPLEAGTLPEGVAFDESRRKVYWVEASYAGARIRRANVDGSGVETVIAGGSAFRGIAIDEAGGRLYWTSSNLAEGARIRRANLDGSNVEVLLDLGTGGANPRGIALDVAAGRMYWADLGGGGAVRRANLDGTAPELFALVGTPYGVAIDAGAGLLYWTNYEQGNIARMPLAGGPSAKLRSGLQHPTYLALDAAGGFVYWVEAGTSAGPRLRRSTLSAGSGIEDLPVALTSWGGLAFSPRGIVDAGPPESVTRFALGPVVPNPVARVSHVSFALPVPARVRLVAYDARGRAVATLAEGTYPAGRHTAAWDGRAGARLAPAGLYFLRLSAPGVELVERIVRLP